VVPARAQMTTLTAALVDEAKRFAPALEQLDLLARRL